MALKLYERHLAREIYASTALVLTAFLMLFAFFDLIHELESIGRGGYQLQHALGYLALTLPGRLYELFPIGVLIGTLYALTVLARHSEITVPVSYTHLDVYKRQTLDRIERLDFRLRG